MNAFKGISFQTAKRLLEKGLNAKAEWSYIAVEDEVFLGQATGELGAYLQFTMLGESREFALEKEAAQVYPAYDRDELYALLPDRIDEGNLVLKLNGVQEARVWVYFYEDAAGFRQMEATDIYEVEAIAKLMLELLDRNPLNTGV
jgi:hypothetical protein